MNYLNKIILTFVSTIFFSLIYKINLKKLAYKLDSTYKLKEIVQSSVELQDKNHILKEEIFKLTNLNLKKIKLSYMIFSDFKKNIFKILPLIFFILIYIYSPLILNLKDNDNIEDFFTTKKIIKKEGKILEKKINPNKTQDKKLTKLLDKFKLAALNMKKNKLNKKETIKKLNKISKSLKKYIKNNKLELKKITKNKKLNKKQLNNFKKLLKNMKLAQKLKNESNISKHKISYNKFNRKTLQKMLKLNDKELQKLEMQYSKFKNKQVKFTKGDQYTKLNSQRKSKKNNKKGKKNKIKIGSSSTNKGIKKFKIKGLPESPAKKSKRVDFKIANYKAFYKSQFIKAEGKQTRIKTTPDKVNTKNGGLIFYRTSQDNSKSKILLQKVLKKSLDTAESALSEEKIPEEYIENIKQYYNSLVPEK